MANHRVSSEMLEQICKDEDVLEVTGEYTGGIGGWGASHEPRHSINNMNMITLPHSK